MRILILSWKDTSHPLAGGAEVFTEEVARSLVQRGHNVTLFAAAVTGRPSRETVGGIEVIRRGSRLTVYHAARRFWDEQPAQSFDVVVDEINTRPFMTPRWVRDTPVVALIFQLAREIWFYETPLPVAALGRFALEPWWLRSYRAVPALTISKSSAESLDRHHGWRDVTVVPVGLEMLEVPHVPKEQQPTVVFLSRLVAMKRPEHALEAFSILTRHDHTARMWIMGDGPHRERLAKALPPGAALLGRVDEKERAARLARAHVLVATSVREGWGLNVSEAAACGTPSIGYRVPGLVDSVQAAGGAVVEPKPEALGKALVDFFAGRLSLQATVSTAAWSEVATAVERRLTEVVEGAVPRRPGPHLQQ